MTILEAMIKEMERMAPYLFLLALSLELQKIETAFQVGAYKKRCNYVIDRNKTLYAIKIIREDINKVVETK